MIRFHSNPYDLRVILTADPGESLEYKLPPLSLTTTKGEIALRDEYSHQELEAALRRNNDIVNAFSTSVSTYIYNYVVKHLLDTAEVMSVPPPATLEPTEMAIVHFYDRPMLQETNTWRKPDERLNGKVLVLPALLHQHWPVMMIVRARAEMTTPDTAWTGDVPDDTAVRFEVDASFSLELGAGRPRLYTYPA